MASLPYQAHGTERVSKLRRCERNNGWTGIPVELTHDTFYVVGLGIVGQQWKGRSLIGQRHLRP